MVTVRLPSILRAYADDLAEIEVEATSIEGALRRVVELHPGLDARLFNRANRLSSHVLVFHQGELIKPERLDLAPFDPADRIDLLVPVSGGSSRDGGPSHDGGPADDVRMRGFRDRVSVEVALAAALTGIVPLPGEPVPVTESAGRVLTNAVTSTVDVPPFRRSAMDGYAVVAEDTFGATAYDPIALQLGGTSMPGVGGTGRVTSGVALRIMTGAPVPDEADAVLRAEDATERDGVVEVRAAVAPGRNVGRVGEDVTAGSVVLMSGRRLLPQDAGLLASIGADPVSVHRRPTVRIVVSGDELLPPGSVPGGYKIVDSNSVMLAALVERDGGVPEVIRVPDDEGALREAIADPGADLVVTSGAASVGTEDRVPILVAALGTLAVHGVTMRPSSPTGVGTVDDVRILILPGNPVSCLVAYDFFGGPVVRRLGGRPVHWPYRTARLRLEERLVSQIGRTDYARVIVRDDVVTPVAISGASILSSVTSADGFVIIPAALEGYAAGTEVTVGLYEGEETRCAKSSS